METKLMIAPKPGKWDTRTLKIASSGRNISKQLSLVVLDNGELKTVLTVRWFQKENSGTVHCAVYPNLSKTGIVGSSGTSASGYGYDKEKTAFAAAMQRSGIDIRMIKNGTESGSVFECMDTERALSILAQKLGYEKYIVV